MKVFRKKMLLPIVALLMGIGLAFATQNSNATQNQYYWFPLDASSGAPQTVNSLIYQSEDPSGCTVGLHYCEGGYSSYIDNGDGTYSADGVRQVTDKKN